MPLNETLTAFLIPILFFILASLVSYLSSPARHPSVGRDQGYKLRKFKADLRDKMVGAFDQNEFRSIAFELCNFDLLRGDELKSKIEALIDLLFRQHDLPSLIDICRRERPNHNWPNLSDLGSDDENLSSSASKGLIDRIVEAFPSIEHWLAGVSLCLAGFAINIAFIVSEKVRGDAKSNLLAIVVVAMIQVVAFITICLLSIKQEKIVVLSLLLSHRVKVMVSAVLGMLSIIVALLLW